MNDSRMLHPEEFETRKVSVQVYLPNEALDDLEFYEAVNLGLNEAIETLGLDSLDATEESGSFFPDSIRFMEDGIHILSIGELKRKPPRVTMKDYK